MVWHRIEEVLSDDLSRVCSLNVHFVLQDHASSAGLDLRIADDDGLGCVLVLDGAGEEYRVALAYEVDENSMRAKFKVRP